MRLAAKVSIYQVRRRHIRDARFQTNRADWPPGSERSVKMAQYTITQLGNINQWVVSTSNNQFIGEYASLALALAYLATVLVYGDNITYVNQPLVTGH